jgi:hypothetical protein
MLSADQTFFWGSSERIELYVRLENHFSFGIKKEISTAVKRNAETIL